MFFFFQIFNLCCEALLRLRGAIFSIDDDDDDDTAASDIKKHNRSLFIIRRSSLKNSKCG